MTETTAKPTPDAIDDVDSLFEEKPTNRLVWIIPSVVLHVIVIAAWFAMPEEEPRVIEERELVIKSEQAEQLKKFVEDANLEELHMEVGRLQEIKAAMKEIRAQQIADLKDFEKEMHGDLKQDAGKIFNELILTQNKALAEQRAAMQQLDKLQQLFKAMKPQLDSKNIVALAPLAKQAGDTRSALKQHQASALEHLRLLQAQFDATDSALSWIKQADIQKKWADLQASQEKIMSLQSESSDKQGQMAHNQGNAMRNLAERGKSHKDSVAKFEAEYKKAEQDYQNNKKRLDEEYTKANKNYEETKQKLDGVRRKWNDKKHEKDNLNRKLTDLKRKKGQEKQVGEVQAKFKQVSHEYNELKKELTRLAKDEKESNKKKNGLHNELKKLRAPRMHGDRDRFSRELNDWVGRLNAGVGETAQQQEAMKQQEAAIQLAQALCGQVKQFMEAAKK